MSHKNMGATKFPWLTLPIPVGKVWVRWLSILWMNCQILTFLRKGHTVTLLLDPQKHHSSAQARGQQQSGSWKVQEEWSPCDPEIHQIPWIPRTDLYIWSYETEYRNSKYRLRSAPITKLIATYLSSLEPWLSWQL